jgi:FixJ family two-component response regulator
MAEEPTVARKAEVSQTPLVVCVEDDLAVREAMRGLLMALGFTVATFSSAEEFLQSGRLDDTSCLITDVRLTGMSGIELQSRLIAMGHAIPIIVITAFPDEGVRVQAMNAGAVCFLTKPITKNDLLTCIDTALKRRSDIAGAPS